LDPQDWFISELNSEIINLIYNCYDSLYVGPAHYTAAASAGQHRVGLEPTTRLFEMSKTVRSLCHVAIVIGSHIFLFKLAFLTYTFWSLSQ
jgi:hypothetical protein